MWCFRRWNQTDRSLVDLLLETLDRPEEDVVAIRVATMARQHHPGEAEQGFHGPLLKERGVYLITGGLGESASRSRSICRRPCGPDLCSWARAAAAQGRVARWLRDESIDAAAAIDHLSRVEMDVVERVTVAPMSGRPGLDDTLDR